MSHFRSKIAIFGLFSLLETADTIKKYIHRSGWYFRYWHSLSLPFRYKYFQKSRISFLVKNGPFQVKNSHFLTIFTFKALRYHKKDKEVDDTSGTGTVCPWRSETNIFENLGFHFWSKIAIFGLFSTWFKQKLGPKNVWEQKCCLI